MSQYYPTQEVMNHPIIEKDISKEEYETVVSEMEKQDTRGWLREYESNTHYKPDFFKAHPFE